MFGINKDLSIHFIGIGGIGMSGIANILLHLGYKVSGSDIKDSSTIQALKANGATVFIGHRAENITDTQLIVYSSAIDTRNPEVVQASELKIPIVKRAEMLAELMRLKYGLAVAGSHGKTTTTSMLSTIFQNAGLNPTCIVGGIVKNLEGQSVIGDGKFLIAEADESDGSFLFLNPIMGVITNIDNDHLDFYKDESKLFEAFRQFTNKVPFYGCISINIDDEKSKQLIPELKRPYVTYSIRGSADYFAKNLRFTDSGYMFECIHQDMSATVNLSMPGKYNVLNALAAISISHRAGIEFEVCCKGIEKFDGVGRRFEYIKNDEQLVVIDDYAHHPTEIKNIVEIFVQKYQSYDKICIFQPHRFSRTQQFWQEFCSSFDGVDRVHIAPIYPAGEEPIDYIDSEVMVKNINEKKSIASYLPDWQLAADLMRKGLGKKKAFLVLGAGSVSREIRSIVEKL